MSGTPDMTLVFTSPTVIEDCAFHPCVRFARWERESVVSFVPPDGVFTLMNYRVAERGGPPVLPVYCRPTVSWREGSARVSFVIGTKPMGMTGSAAGAVRTSSGGISSNMGAAMSAAPGGGPGASEPGLEDVRLVVSFPAVVKTVDLASDAGSVSIDPRTNVLTWTLSRMPRDRNPELVGNVYLSAPAAAAAAGGAPIESIHAVLSYVLPGASVSGLGVRELHLSNEGYKFFKGFRTATRSGRITIRT